MQFAIAISRIESRMAKTGIALLAACTALGLSAAAQAQDDEKVVRNQEPDIQDVIMTPVDDLNLNDDGIPVILATAAKNPYAKLEQNDCEGIELAIAELDAVLGPDYDIVNDGTDPFSEGKIAQRLVGSLIPFRGILREVTGAAGEERELEAAIVAGLTRRGYLKGLGEASECPYPARPAFVAIEIDEDDAVDMNPTEED